MICTKCKKELPEDNFFWRDKEKGKRHRSCKNCYGNSRRSKEHYQKYKNEYIIRAKKRNQRVRLELKKKLFEYLSSKQCLVCGERDVIVLDFHHRDRSSKKFNIAIMVRDVHAWESILKEIEKCDVMCANCHRRETAKEFGWYRLNVA